MNVQAFDINARYKKLLGDWAVYGYLGQLGKHELNDVLQTIEQTLEANVDTKFIRKKLFNILIEVTQNLHNYSEGQELLTPFLEIFIIVQQEGNDIVITTGNFILNKEIPHIRTRLDIINSLDEEEIKNLYRGILTAGGVSEHGGAGLGLIDLARRSSEKLSYMFEDIDNKFSFFTLKVTVVADE